MDSGTPWGGRARVFGFGPHGRSHDPAADGSAPREFWLLEAALVPAEPGTRVADGDGFMAGPGGDLIAVGKSPPIVSYEELDGGKGREVFFRPDRYRTSELGLTEPVARVTIRDRSHDCELVDISQNGLAFQCPPDLSVEAGDRIAQIVVQLDGHEAYRGDARVISVRDANEGRRLVGVSLTEALVSIEDVLVLRDIKAWARDRSQRVRLLERPWFVPGYERFKALVSELGLFLRDAQKQLGSLEVSLPFQVVHGELECPARAALIESLRDEFVQPIVRYSEEIDAALAGAPPVARQALKEFSLRQVQDLLMQINPFVSITKEE